VGGGGGGGYGEGGNNRYKKVYKNVWVPVVDLESSPSHQKKMDDVGGPKALNRPSLTRMHRRPSVHAVGVARAGRGGPRARRAHAACERFSVPAKKKLLTN
jgi:hypothetical protein